MSNRNLSLNTANWKKLEKLMKQTNKSTRQAAVAEVLDKAGKCEYFKCMLHSKTNQYNYIYSELQDSDKKLRNLKVHSFFCSILLVTIAIAGWIL